MIRQAAYQGLALIVGIEPEFFLVIRDFDGQIRGWDPDGVDDLRKPCYDYKGMSGALGFLRAMTDGLDRLGWGATQANHEAANSQYDINFRYADALTTADRLIVTAGAWIGRLLPGLATPLRPTRQQVLYFRPPDPAAYAIGQYPVFIYKGEADPDAYYGMPESLGMGVKVARHGGSDVDPDAVDRTVGEGYRDEVRGFLARTIPGLATAPIDRAEVCLYTMAEGERFRLGPLPGRPDVIVASPCSGHGFKFSCLIGRVLADLAIDGATPIAIEPWKLDG